MKGELPLKKTICYLNSSSTTPIAPKSALMTSPTFALTKPSTTTPVVTTSPAFHHFNYKIHHF